MKKKLFYFAVPFFAIIIIALIAFSISYHCVYTDIKNVNLIEDPFDRLDKINELEFYYKNKPIKKYFFNSSVISDLQNNAFSTIKNDMQNEIQLINTIYDYNERLAKIEELEYEVNNNQIKKQLFDYFSLFSLKYKTYCELRKYINIEDYKVEGSLNKKPSEIINYDDYDDFGFEFCSNAIGTYEYLFYINFLKKDLELNNKFIQYMKQYIEVDFVEVDNFNLSLINPIFYMYFIDSETEHVINYKNYILFDQYYSYIVVNGKVKYISDIIDYSNLNKNFNDLIEKYDLFYGDYEKINDFGTVEYINIDDKLIIDKEDDINRIINEISTLNFFELFYSTGDELAGDSTIFDYGMRDYLNNKNLYHKLTIKNSSNKEYNFYLTEDLRVYYAFKSIKYEEPLFFEDGVEEVYEAVTGGCAYLNCLILSLYHELDKHTRIVFNFDSYNHDSNYELVNSYIIENKSEFKDSKCVDLVQDFVSKKLELYLSDCFKDDMDYYIEVNGSLHEIKNNRLIIDFVFDRRLFLDLSRAIDIFNNAIEYNSVNIIPIIGKDANNNTYNYNINIQFSVEEDCHIKYSAIEVLSIIGN